MRPRKQKPDTRERTLWIALLLFTWMIIIIWRLGWLQVVRYEHYLAKAARNQTKEVELVPARGAIMDRNGRELAYTVIADSVFVDLKLLKEDQDRQKAARLLAPLIRQKEPDLLRKLAGDASFVWVKRKIEPEATQSINSVIAKSNLNGVAIRKETQRFYPNDSLAAHLIGYVGSEDRGLAGLEQTQDVHLRGKPGELALMKDGQGRPYERREIPAIGGAQLITTIDAALQHKVEVLLDEALKMTRARGASAVVLDPSNGEILALANAPSFNPNERPKTADDTARHNRAISFPYEPGSVFKLVTYAAAFEEGLVTPDEKVNCGNGEITVGKRVIHDVHSYGVISVADAFAKSSNVGAIRIAQRVGKERLYEYINRFGFGRKTGVELPGESRGIVNPLRSWRPDSIASIAIGHEVSVTSLQAVAAMSAIANRGVWTQPHLVKQIVTQDGRILYDAKTEARRVVSEQTAERMRGLLERVVTHGTGRHAIQLAGYTAAGKTGTAQKVDERTGAYSKTKFMPSFAGFVPASNPRFTIIVMIDEPSGAHYGGIVAAPVFSLIAEAALGDYLVPPDDKNFRESLVKLSKKYEERVNNENALLGTASSEIKEMTKDPQTGARSQNNRRKNQKTGVDISSGVMPDFRGRGVRAVMRACAELNLSVKLHGSGTAVKQIPAPGTMVKSGDECRVEFQ
ncbi:MAG: transpeptidase family protein [Acidobacteria bacterium]|nr:transpeptidase family protein [Acidobacteriota bacterium]